MADTKTKSALSGVVSQLPVDRLKQEARGFGQALTQKGMSQASERVQSMTGRLTDLAEGKTGPKMAKNIAEGDSVAKAGVKATASKVKDTVKDKLGSIGGGGGGDKLKVTNILESIDVPVSREVAYQQWTLFEEFSNFMKKVENVEQQEDEKVKWRAQIFWSHRTWDAEIVDQVPNERIVWKSDGEKGHVDGAITFHELAPDLTRILMVLEYHPKGLFEHTGNLWRAQGRRARLELKHFARHVSTETLLHQDELEGWGGEIHDGEVTESQEDSDEEQGPDESAEDTDQDAGDDEEREPETKPAAQQRQGDKAASKSKKADRQASAERSAG